MYLGIFINIPACQARFHTYIYPGNFGPGFIRNAIYFQNRLGYPRFRANVATSTSDKFDADKIMTESIAREIQSCDVITLDQSD